MWISREEIFILNIYFSVCSSRMIDQNFCFVIFFPFCIADITLSFRLIVTITRASCSHFDWFSIFNCLFLDILSLSFSYFFDYFSYLAITCFNCFLGINQRPSSSIDYLFPQNKVFLTSCVLLDRFLIISYCF